MLSRKKHLIFFIFIIFFAQNAKAYQDLLVEPGENERFSELLLRAKVAAAIPFYEDSFTVNGTPSDFTIEGDGTALDSTAYGIDFALVHFWNRHFATEFSLGIFGTSSKLYTFNDPDTDETFSDDGRFIYSPFNINMQYYFAPDREYSPYLGLGYHASIVYETIGNVNFDTLSHGFALQAGLDWWLKKDIGLNFEIKKLFLTVDGDYSKTLSNFTIKSEEDVDPLILSVGIVYDF